MSEKFSEQVKIDGKSSKELFKHLVMEIKSYATDKDWTETQLIGICCAALIQMVKACVICSSFHKDVKKNILCRLGEDLILKANQPQTWGDENV